MPVATGASQGTTATSLPSQNTEANTLDEDNQNHLPTCSEALNDKNFSLYESFNDDHGTSVIFSSSQRPQSSIRFQLPSSNRNAHPVDVVQPHTSTLSSVGDTRENARRRLVAPGHRSDQLRTSPSPCLARRKSGSPTRKRLRTSSFNEHSYNTKSNSSGNIRHTTVSSLKKRVLAAQTREQPAEASRYSVIEPPANHAFPFQEAGLECNEMNDAMSDNERVENNNPFASFNVRCPNDRDISSNSSEASLQSGSTLNPSIAYNSVVHPTYHRGIRVRSEQDGNPVNNALDVCRESCLMSADVEAGMYAGNVFQGDTEMRGVVYHGIDSELDVLQGTYHSPGVLNSRNCYPTDFHQSSPNPRHTNGRNDVARQRNHQRSSVVQQPPFTTMPTRPELTPQHPVASGLDRMQYTSALSSPITASSVAIPVNNRTPAMPCTAPRRVVAVPPPDTPMLRHTGYPVNLQHQTPVYPQTVRSLQDQYHYRPNALSHPPLSRQAPHHHHHHHAAGSRYINQVDRSYPRLSSAVPPRCSQIPSIYPLPTLHSLHLSSNMPESTQHQMYPQHGTSRMHPICSGSMHMGSAQQSSLRHNQVGMIPAQFNHPGSMMSYGLPAAAARDIPSNHHMSGTRQMPIQYYPSVHTISSDNSRVDSVRSYVPSSAAQAVPSHTIPTHFMPAVHSVYQDHTTYDTLASQNLRRPVPSSSLHPSALHSQPLVVPPWNMHPHMPHLVALRLPTLQMPSFMFSPLVALPSYVSYDDDVNLADYETLANLTEQLGDVKPGLTKPSIDKLPSYRYKTGTQNNNQLTCVICMCEWEPKQLLRVLPCNHEFHAKCVDRWLKRNRTCPICRSDAGKRTWNATNNSARTANASAIRRTSAR